MNRQLNKVLEGLSNEGISNHCKSGMITKKVGELACTTFHVCGKFYPWDTTPKYFIARSFFANCSFADLLSTKKGIETYNRKNKDKIYEFQSLSDVENFLNS